MEVEHAPAIHPKRPPRFSKWPPLILAGIFLMVFCWNGLSVRHWDSAPVRFVTAIIPIPAATVNGAIVSYHDVLKRKDVLVWSSPDQEVNEEQLLSAALDVLIEQEAARQIAKKMGVEVTRDEVNAAREKLIGEMSDADYKKKIKEELNMSDRAFTASVLEPLALAQALESAVLASSEEQSAPKAEALGVLASLNAGESFSSLAQAHSDDPSAESGGDLGYLTQATLPAGWDALLSTPEGGRTPIMETDRAFVVAEATWLVGNEDDVQIRTRAIIIKKRQLSEVVDQFIQTSTVRRFLYLGV